MAGRETTVTDVAQTGDWFEDGEGQLAIDAYQTDEAVVIKAPIAGVRREDLEVSVTDEVVTMKGLRHDATAPSRDAYFVQECYWGSFVRSYVLPVAVDADRAQALLKDGLLTLTIPKLERSKPRLIPVHDATD
ncbi:Hsp20/alpha crystallin family protein [Candidatus Berkelbacteria bacterium]|nr:Hsp20/alpha crystallin family protein [Candidatus Berkelbacteria bacterium]